jgi:hypothetical protein
MWKPDWEQVMVVCNGTPSYLSQPYFMIQHDLNQSNCLHPNLTGCPTDCSYCNLGCAAHSPSRASVPRWTGIPQGSSQSRRSGLFKLHPARRFTGFPASERGRQRPCECSGSCAKPEHHGLPVLFATADDTRQPQATLIMRRPNQLIIVQRTNCIPRRSTLTCLR